MPLTSNGDKHNSWSTFPVRRLCNLSPQGNRLHDSAYTYEKSVPYLLLHQEILVILQAIKLAASSSKMSTLQAPLEIWKQDDDWTEIAEREERKKRQNRLNQRAYRKRNEKKDTGKAKQRPFRVERFRITEVPVAAPHREPQLSQTQSVEIITLPEGSTAETPSPASSSETSLLNQAGRIVAFANSQFVASDIAHSFFSNEIGRVVFPVIPESIDTFPFSSDHLIHLIHYNVYRALIGNKQMVSSSTFQISIDQTLIIPSPLDLCEGLAIIRLTGQKALPPNLEPTNVQMNVAHSSWLNMFPYPKVRDNLITRQDGFNHIDFCNDLWGEFFMSNMGDLVASNVLTSFIQKDDDELTAGRRGLVVWGDPWDTQGWEVTEGFVNKWFWVIEGCVELFASTNFWRAKRDLEPLVFPATADSYGMI